MPQPTTPEILQAALIDLMIAAAPFRCGRGMTTPRNVLDAAISRATQALKAAKIDDIDVDWKGLKRMAEEADAAAKEQPGFRADLNG